MRQTKPTTTQPKNGSVNPFARALAETEKFSQTKQDGADYKQSSEGNSAFSKALAKNRPFSANKFDGNQFNQEPSLKDQERAKQREIFRMKRHEEINLTDIFNAQKIRTQKELETVRVEIEKLTNEMDGLRQDLKIAASKVTVNAGVEGIGDFSYLHQLRQFVLLIRKQVKSANTWLHASNGKNSKRRAKGMVGIAMTGTKAAHDTMHHEVSTAYSGN